MEIPALINIPDEVFVTCNQEPIHIPGEIQPHGVLLAFSIPEGRLVYASTNAPSFLGVDWNNLVRLRLHDWLGVNEIREHLDDELVSLLRDSATHRLPLKFSGRLRFFAVEAHLSDDGNLILEIEPPLENEYAESIIPENMAESFRLKRVLLSIENLPSFQAAMEKIASNVRSITRYDRVMIYRFDHLGHGEVIVDDRREDLESYLGLHYPASDIPEQARKLFLRNRVRQIVDVASKQVRVVRLPHHSEKEDSRSEALDMSLCYLRSASPVHCLYLSNMQVRSTLAVSVVLDNKLWGMIICHHGTPKYLSPEMRYQCDTLAHVLSLAIQSEERRQHEQDVLDSQACYQRVESVVRSRRSWQEELFSDDSVLLGLLDAAGAIYVTEERRHSVGKVPSMQTVDRICEQLRNVGLQDLRKAESFCDLNIPEFDSSLDGGGYLAVVIAQSPATYLIWFRKGQSQIVNWGGDPRKVADSFQVGQQLVPRASFEKWKQEIVGWCVPWTKQDELRAKAIGLFISVKKVEDANRLKSQFLTNMSHEIRTPMTAILGYADILLDQLTEESSAAREATETILRNGNHLLSILNDILDLAKIESGKLLIQHEEIPLALFITETINLVSINASKKKIDLRTLLAPNLPTRILSDPVRLKQILLNLLSNAIKFTDSGSVTLRVDVDSPRIDDSDVISFTVTDTGPGISEENLDRLFRPFVQGDGALSRKQGGTGLGLVISRHLAESMSGSLKATSTIGVGSQFVATFKVGRVAESPLDVGLQKREGLKQSSQTIEAKESNLQSQQARSQEHSAVRILVAEDGLDNQRLIEWLLKKRMSATVTLVENGLKAIEAVIASELAEPYQVVLMDVQMPEMDGLTAVKLLREKGYEVPIIALTAHASEHDRALSVEAGCNAHVTKPIKWDELNQAIAAVLN